MATDTIDQRSVGTELAAFVSELSFADVPAEAVRLAERCFVDTTGVAIAGAAEGAGAITAATVSETDGPESVSLLGHDGRASITDAAYVNGTAAHGLDFDDVSHGMRGHPSVTMVPALLGMGQAESASGTDLLTAFVAGFETQCYLSGPINPDHYEVGWHSTATLGTFGTAAAAANLLELDEAETRNALSIAASLPAGLKRNFGSTTKPIHAGAAARSGVSAALAAAEGATGDERAIDGDRGFFDLYSGPDGPNHEDRHTLGEYWALLEDGVQVKKYPCCNFTHTSITLASTIADEHAIDPQDVESVEVVFSQGAADALHHADPDTGLEAKFSLEYTVASAIARDRVGLSAFDDENVDDPSVQAVRERVSKSVDPDLHYGSHRATVTVRTTAGDVFEETREEPPGTVEEPLSDAELREKFRMCATRVFERARADDLYDRLDSLRDESDVSGLVGSM